MVVEFADLVGFAVAFAEDDPDAVVGFAAEALEVVAAVFFGDVGEDIMAAVGFELDDGSAQGLVAGIGDGAGEVAEGVLHGLCVQAGGKAEADDGCECKEGAGGVKGCGGHSAHCLVARACAYAACATTTL